MARACARSSRDKFDVNLDYTYGDGQSDTTINGAGGGHVPDREERAQLAQGRR